MAIKEQSTNYEVQMSLDGDVTSNTASAGAIIDAADYDNGVGFALCLSTAPSAGTFTLSVQEGDESDGSDMAAAANTVWSSNPAITSQTSDGDNWVKQAVYSNKRYVRGVVTSTGISGTGHVTMVAILFPEVLPTSQT